MSTTLDPAEIAIDLAETYDYDGDLDDTTVQLTKREGETALYLRVNGEVVDCFSLLGLADELDHL
jgi:hypothetical protein